MIAFIKWSSFIHSVPRIVAQCTRICTIMNIPIFPPAQALFKDCALIFLILRVKNQANQVNMQIKLIIISMFLIMKATILDTHGSIVAGKFDGWTWYQGGSMNQNFGVIVWGHDTRLSALAAHPDHEIGFVTTGYDKMVTRSLFHQQFTCFVQLFSSYGLDL